MHIQGRFDHWVPVAVEASSPDQGSAQIFFDVTGLDRGGPRARSEADLFTFTSDSAMTISPFAYLAKGFMERGDRKLPAEALIQTPAAHTPFVSITFAVDRGRFADLWDDLDAVVTTPADGSIPLQPRAWLRMPTLASA
jgi:hypothetical protein